jgi:hypothetical protein
LIHGQCLTGDAEVVIWVLALALLAGSVQAQDWRWELDQGFLSPRCGEEFASFEGAYVAGGMYDLNEDNRPEYVMAYQTESRVHLYLAVMEGDFPEVRWNFRDGFFNDLDLGRGFHPTAITFFDLDEDGQIEIIFDSGIVITNRGDFNRPDWILDNDLYPVNEVRSSTSNFCDWDDDRNTDLILGYGDGYYRFERNDQREWELLGFWSCFENLRGVAVYTHDLNDDGVIDIIGKYQLPEGGTAVLSIINTGSPGEPTWSEPIELTAWGFRNPFPFDVDDDGSSDLIDEFRYQLHAADPNAVTWLRPVYWRLSGIPLAAHDIDDDQRVELFYSIPSGPFESQDWRLGQFRLGEFGWEDAQFFRDDLEEWGRGPVVVDGLSFVDLLGTGNPQIVLSVATDPEAPRIELYEDRDTTAGWDWQPVNGFFSRIIRPSQTLQIPTFGDFDLDGDLDMAMIEGPDFGVGTIFLYENRRVNQVTTWIRRNDWLNGLPDTMRVRSIGATDFDGDRNCDLLTVGSWAGSLPLRLYRNVAEAGDVEWQWDQQAFADSGPDSVYHFTVADINNDNKPDILAGRQLKQPQVWINRTPNSVRADSILPKDFIVVVTPNPANSTAKIRYFLPRKSEVTIQVFDPAGRLMTSESLGVQSAGIFDKTLELSTWSSGSYLIEIEAGRDVGRSWLEVVK